MHVPGAGKHWKSTRPESKLTQGVFFTDKHPQLNEFLTQIKNTPDLANLFESIQKDTSSGMDTFSMAMDISWRDGRREAGHGEASSSTVAERSKKRIHQLENGASSSSSAVKISKVKLHWILRILLLIFCSPLSLLYFSSPPLLKKRKKNHPFLTPIGFV